MSISKSLYAAPEGLESLSDGDEIEIEISDDEAKEAVEPTKIPFDANLAEYLDQGTIQSIVSELVADVDEDVSSRRDWMQAYVDGIQLLGLKIEERTDPWPGACGVTHPLLTESIIKFQAETMQSQFPAAGPVKTEIIGKETQEKKDAATRVSEDLNYRLTDQMVEFRPEHERMLWGTGMSGNGFKKVYYDPALGRPTSIFVPAEDLIVPYGSSSLETAERVTHVMRKTENELRKLQYAGFYCDVDLGEPTNTFDEVEKKIAEKMGFRASVDDRYKLLEINVDLDIPGLEDEDKHGNPTGIKLPYIVTIEKGTHTCLAIRRNWKPKDKLKKKRQHFVHYGYIPGFGFYNWGLIHLVGGYAKSGTMIIRQLVDAGTLSNLPGGFKTRGLRVKGDDTPIAPAEFRDVDVPSGTIKDNIMTLPYKEPSQVLAALLDKIIEDGRSLAQAADMQVADMSANTPVGTTLAILERTLKVMTSVQARMHYSFKQELRLLRDIVRDYTPDKYDYDPQEGDRAAKKSDYDMVDVIPVSDPNAATMAQKIVQYQAVLQLAQQAPQIYDLPQLHRQMLDVLGIKNAQKLVPIEDDQLPTDPISENLNATKGKPLKAFISQDHNAHITAHNNFLQDPMVMQTIGQNPMANTITAALQAHITEHMGYKYRALVEQQTGVALPPPDQVLPPDVEVQLSRIVAAASAQVLQQSQTQKQQQDAKQQAQDPIVQMQQAQMQIAQQDSQTKAQKVQVETQIAQQRLQLDQQKLQSTQQIAMAKIQEETERSHEIQANKTSAQQAMMQMQAQRDAAKQAAEHAKQTENRQAEEAKQAAQQANQHSMDRLKLGLDAARSAADIDQKNNKTATDAGLGSI